MGQFFYHKMQVIFQANKCINWKYPTPELRAEPDFFITISILTLSPSNKVSEFLNTREKFREDEKDQTIKEKTKPSTFK